MQGTNPASTPRGYTLKKCGRYVKVAVTWHIHVAMRWQLGESGIDVVDSWLCVTL